MDWPTTISFCIVSAFSIFFCTRSILSSRHVPHVLLKAIVASALGGYVPIILHHIGNVFIGLTFLALVTIGYFVFFWKIDKIA